MSPVTLAWLLRRLSQGDAVNGTRQSIWDAHIDLYRHTGASAGIEAEHQGREAIAYNLREMFRLDVPIICTVIGRVALVVPCRCGRTPVDV